MDCRKAEALYWIWVTSLGRPSNEIATILLEEYGSLDHAWRVSNPADLTERIRGKEGLAERLLGMKCRDWSKRVMEKCDHLGVSVVTVSQAEYPESLLSISAKPLVLYYYGELPAALPQTIPLLAVVGSRRATAYGRNTAFRFSRQLAEAGVGIVSGLARGIDSQAHMGALAGNGYTIAVLGGGPDNIYPAENRKLYEQIREEGCILSEFAPGTEAMRSHFPARNRIIAGLGQGTLVCEAKRSSGAMITVDRTLEGGREVYAVPGNVDSPNSEGCNYLIRTGAICVTTCQDILENMGYMTSADSSGPLVFPGLIGAEYAVAQAVSQGMRNEETLFTSLAYPPSELQCALTMLEIKGVLERLPSGEYCLFQRKT